MEHPPNQPLRFLLPSEQVARNITEKPTEWDAKGFLKVKDKKLYRAMLSYLRLCKAPTIFRIVTRSQSPQGVDGANKLAHHASQVIIRLGHECRVHECSIAFHSVKTLDTRVYLRATNVSTRVSPECEYPFLRCDF